MKCLESSYDKMLGPYSDLSKLGRKEAVKFADCQTSDPLGLQRFRVRRLVDEAGFILHPL